MYTILGVNLEGRKEVLGLYISENEGANFWLQVLTDLSNRGVTDILIACIDGLKGFPEAIEAISPETEVQLCIVHQIRNSMKYVGSKNQKESFEILTNLKMNLENVTEELAAKDFYGKIIEFEGESAQTQMVRFTSVPPEVDSYFQAHLQYTTKQPHRESN